MDLVGQSPDALFELANDQRVDILIGRSGEKFRRHGRGPHRLERLDDAPPFVRGKNPHLLESAGEGLRTADIGVDQAAVEMKRAGEALEDL